jgi:membrane fusion protein (multidrug efflux system)
VQARKIGRSVDISGSLAAPDDSVIAAEVEGKLVGLRFDLGDRVRKGDVLARINPDEFRLRLQQTEAQLRHAETNLRRIEELAKAEAVAPQQLDDVRSAAAQARANHDLARKKLADTEVRAPFAGAVARRLVSPGEYVKVGQPLFQIVVLDPLKMIGEVPERYLADVQVGDQVTAAVDAFPGRSFEGKVSRIGPAVNPQSRAFTIEARIDNKDRLLKPGLFAKLAVRFAGERDATLVPEAALSAFAGVTKVFLIADGAARERKVDVEQHLPDGLVVVQGELKPGERVATAGLARLADGVRVAVRGDGP